MAGQRNWGCICSAVSHDFMDTDTGPSRTSHKSSRDNTNGTSPDTMQDLNNRLDFRVVEWVGRGISINAHSIDSRFVTLRAVRLIFLKHPG